MKKFLTNEITLFFIVLAVVIVFASMMGLGDRATNGEQNRPKLGKDEIIIVDGKTGKVEISKDKEFIKMARFLEKSDKEYQKNNSPEKRIKRYKSVMEEINAKMFYPKEGEYPVKFFDPDVVPRIAYLGRTIGMAKPFAGHWINEKQFLYIGSAYVDKGSKNASVNYADKHKILFLLNVDSGAIKEMFSLPAKGGVCFDYKTRNMLYAYKFIDGVGKARYKFFHKYGYLDKNNNFVEEFDSKDKKPVYINFCKPFFEGELNYSLFRHEDGKVKHAKEGAEPSTWIFTRPDGTTKKFIAGRGYGGWNYDYIRDLYFLSNVISRKDQRTKVTWLDKNMAIVEEKTYPRYETSSNLYNSFLKTPARDGFVSGYCERDKALCLVTPEKIIVLLRGLIRNYSVSPDGCRVFGYWREDDDKKLFNGKNFLIELCKQQQEKE